MKNYLECYLSWYKQKEIIEDSSQEITTDWPLMKVVWYFPIVPRKEDTKNFRWHVDERICDKLLNWLYAKKNIDDQFPQLDKKM